MHEYYIDSILTLNAAKNKLKNANLEIREAKVTLLEDFARVYTCKEKSDVLEELIAAIHESPSLYPVEIYSRTITETVEQREWEELDEEEKIEYDSKEECVYHCDDQLIFRETDVYYVNHIAALYVVQGKLENAKLGITHAKIIFLDNFAHVYADYVKLDITKALIAAINKSSCLYRVEIYSQTKIITDQGDADVYHYHDKRVFTKTFESRQAVVQRHEEIVKRRYREKLHLEEDAIPDKLSELRAHVALFRDQKKEILTSEADVTTELEDSRAVPAKAGNSRFRVG